MGDVQAVEYFEGQVYFGFHDGFGGNRTFKLLSADASTGALADSFRPTFDQFWGVFSIDATATGLFAGGSFSKVGDSTANHLVRFLGYPGADQTSTPVLLLDGGATQWRYWDRGQAPSGWRAATFNDADWPTGVAEIGYGDGDEATVVSFGPSASRKYITTYLRTSFELESFPSELAVHLVADDGAVVYVNGTEVARDNMPVGPITYPTTATTGRAGGAESTVRAFTIDPSVLDLGQNVLAIEVHQAGPRSSDLSLDADLTAVLP